MSELDACTDDLQSTRRPYHGEVSVNLEWALLRYRVNAYMGRHATRVQALRRGAVQRRAFLCQRAAAVRLQAAWRASVARRALSAARASAVTVQRAWRGYVARSHFHRMRRICTTIQSAWRCYSQRTRCSRAQQMSLPLEGVSRAFVGGLLCHQDWSQALLDDRNTPMHLRSME